MQRAWGEPAAGAPRDRSGPGPGLLSEPSTDDQVVCARLCELAAVRRRFGWRQLQVLPLRESVRLNHKKLRRLYVAERPQVRRRIGRKRAVGKRPSVAALPGSLERSVMAG